MISSPTAVVKELLENSLDSGATSIQVRVDSTTIGHMQVSDNGPGVRVGRDRELLAVPSTTSKIENFGDILAEPLCGGGGGDIDISNKSLGFRGEALACIADLAESPPNTKLRVTTRCSHEKMGQTWLIERNGTAIFP